MKTLVEAWSRHMGAQRHFPGRAKTRVVAKTQGRAKTLPEEWSAKDTCHREDTRARMRHFPKTGRAKTRVIAKTHGCDRSGEDTLRREDTRAREDASRRQVGQRHVSSRKHMGGRRLVCTDQKPLRIFILNGKVKDVVLRLMVLRVGLQG